MNTPQYVLVAEKDEKLPSGLEIKKGTFLVERQNGGAFLSQSKGLVLERFTGRYTPPAETPIQPGNEVLFIRPGGYGDLLFATPLFRHAKAMGCRVVVSCFGHFSNILRNNPDVDEIVPYPVPMEAWDRASRHVWLERILEDGIKNEIETMTENAIDLYARVAGMELTDKSMKYVITDAEAAWVHIKYPKKKKPRVGIQLKASALNRTYPFQHLQMLAGLLNIEGFEVFLFGEPGLLAGCEGPFVDLTADNLKMRESCAVVGSCDAMVTPDSSLCHVAGALGIPTVALYGPFLSQTRTKYADSVNAINGKAPCAPCNHHDNTGIPWPQGCPGRNTGYCQALANIPPALVSAQVAHMIAARMALLA